MSEGALFKSQLGPRWATLPQNIRQRFDHDPIVGTVVSYQGVMQFVRCTRLGRIIGWLMQHTGALMPHQGKDVPVDIEVWTDSNRAVHKRRTYYFDGKPPFVFQSRMELQKDGRLVEHVGGGLGMYVSVLPDAGGLRFHDAGYFLALGAVRIPLPRLLALGHVALAHADVSPDEFDIVIDISHPLWGPLYRQEGRFRHAGEAPLIAKV